MVSVVEEVKMELDERILNLLEEKNYPEIKDILCNMNPADIASLFEDLNIAKIPLLFRLLPKV